MGWRDGTNPANYPRHLEEQRYDRMARQERRDREHRERMEAMLAEVRRRVEHPTATAEEKLASILRYMNRLEVRASFPEKE